jgi:hypothetical protein
LWRSFQNTEFSNNVGVLPDIFRPLCLVRRMSPDTHFYLDIRIGRDLLTGIPPLVSYVSILAMLLMVSQTSQQNVIA